MRSVATLAAALFMSTAASSAQALTEVESLTTGFFAGEDFLSIFIREENDGDPTSFPPGTLTLSGNVSGQFITCEFNWTGADILDVKGRADTAKKRGFAEVTADFTDVIHLMFCDNGSVSELVIMCADEQDPIRRSIQGVTHEKRVSSFGATVDCEIAFNGRDFVDDDDGFTSRTVTRP